MENLLRVVVLFFVLAGVHVKAQDTVSIESLLQERVDRDALAVSFFSIPFAKGCKITVSDCPFFYVITCREYDPGTPVKSLTQKDFVAAGKQMHGVGEQRLNPEPSSAEHAAGTEAILAPGQEEALDLREGVAAVRTPSVKLGNDDDPEITRKVVLKVSFDGKHAVWCPIGEFFGCGIGLNSVQGWNRSVGDDGLMTARWVMPYQTSATRCA